VRPIFFLLHSTPAQWLASITSQVRRPYPSQALAMFPIYSCCVDCFISPWPFVVKVSVLLVVWSVICCWSKVWWEQTYPGPAQGQLTNSLIHELIHQIIEELGKKILACDLWIIVCMLHQQDRVRIRGHKNLACGRGAFLYISFASNAFFWQKVIILPYLRKEIIMSVFDFNILSQWAYQLIGNKSVSKLDSNTQWSQRHNL